MEGKEVEMCGPSPDSAHTAIDPDSHLAGRTTPPTMHENKAESVNPEPKTSTSKSLPKTQEFGESENTSAGSTKP
jgi:hypothetical protein